MVLGEGKKLLLLHRKLSLKITILDLESCCGQSLDIVATVDAAVVILPEYARALLGAGYRVILETLFALQIYGRENHSPTSGAQYAENLAQRLPVILDMLQNMVANHHLLRPFAQRYILNIEVHIS